MSKNLEEKPISGAPEMVNIFSFIEEAPVLNSK